MTQDSTPRSTSPATDAPNGAQSPHTPAPRVATRFDDRAAELIATWFGCGRSPRAPGTLGALGALPVHWVLSRVAPVPHALVVVLVSAAGIWASGRRAEFLGEKDPQSIVVDEVAGTLIALGIVRNRSLAAQLAALILFRVLDITKPGAIDSAQYAKPVGLGIMADDLLAGAAAGALARWLFKK